MVKDVNLNGKEHNIKMFKSRERKITKYTLKTYYVLTSQRLNIGYYMNILYYMNIINILNELT